ncbi:MAG: ankyrin repeat domain-containing protein [Gemmatimonadaceae bacterium]|nr:ankyrin repeat domain-containing protein [Gemmatimonadaceae bacterium]
MSDVAVATLLAALQRGDTTAALGQLAAEPALGRHCIHTAAAVADAEAVRTFLATDRALARARLDGTGVEPLLFAVADELKSALAVPAAAHLETVRLLLDAGADPNAAAPLPDVSETIPALYFPCVRGNAAVARLLLEHGANPTDGESLYHAAQHDHRTCLALLREFGADLHRGPAEHGNTPLHFLASHTPDNPVTPAATRGMSWLLEAGADPTVPSFAGMTAHPQAGETPLHRAAAVGHGTDVLTRLVRHGARPDQRRDDGATAYQLAVRGGHVAAAAALASVGADTTVTAIDALLAACHRGDEQAARAELDAHPGLLLGLPTGDRDALGRAVGEGRLEAVRVMCAIGWPMDQEGEWGGTPLHWAAWQGRTDIVRMLLAHGAPVNLRDTRYGSSPIAWVAHGSRFCDRANDEDYPRIAELLLDAGATRAASFNHWSEPPESLARPSVAAVLRDRGFLTGESTG